MLQTNDFCSSCKNNHVDRNLCNSNLRTYIELDKQAINHNIGQIKKILGSTEIAAVVKSNAYGHGIFEIANIIDSNNAISWFCTAGISEAIFLKKNGIKKQILVLSFFDDDITLAIKLNIHLCIYNFDDLVLLDTLAQQADCIVNVHLKVDTGMSRLGIKPDDILSFVKKLQQYKHVKLFGIFTHLCDVPNRDQSFSNFQIRQFNNVLDILAKSNIKIECTHLQSSSGLYLKLERKYTFARIGAFLYGLWKTDEHKQIVAKFYPDFYLKPVLTWKTKIIQIKPIEKGSIVGYGKTFTAKKDMILAILAIGYFDGYPRGLSNNSFVLIKNKLAPVIGIISMNLMTIDITDLNNVSINDEVTLIGDHQSITAQEIAKNASIITNEFVTRINTSIPRIIS